MLLEHCNDTINITPNTDASKLKPKTNPLQKSTFGFCLCDLCLSSQTTSQNTFQTAPKTYLCSLLFVHAGGTGWWCEHVFFSNHTHKPTILNSHELFLPTSPYVTPKKKSQGRSVDRVMTNRSQSFPKASKQQTHAGGPLVFDWGITKESVRIPSDAALNKICRIPLIAADVPMTCAAVLGFWKDYSSVNHFSMHALIMIRALKTNTVLMVLASGHTGSSDRPRKAACAAHASYTHRARPWIAMQWNSTATKPENSWGNLRPCI